MQFALRDPMIPGLGELACPGRRRSTSTPSPNLFTVDGKLWIMTTNSPSRPRPHQHRHVNHNDIHAEIEMEQEAQVNRMLLVIREQQHQLKSLQKTQAQLANCRLSSQQPLCDGNSTAIDDSSSLSERTISFPAFPQPARRNSRPYTPSIGTRSPARRSSLTNDLPDWPPSPTDTSLLTNIHRNTIRGSLCEEEHAVHQAEVAALVRENRLLRIRVKELEKQMQDTHHSAAGYPNTPPTHSHLSTTMLASTSDDEFGDYDDFNEPESFSKTPLSPAESIVCDF